MAHGSLFVPAHLQAIFEIIQREDARNLPYDLADEERPGAAPEGWISWILWIPSGKSTDLGESMKGIPSGKHTKSY